MVATTQLTLALEIEEERRAKRRFGFDLDLTCIEIRVSKNKKLHLNELIRPVMGTIFLVILCQIIEAGSL